MFGALRVPALVAGSLIIFSHNSMSQNRASDPPPLEITLTADRIPTSIQRTGSAVTVISAEEVQKRNQGSLVDVLRSVPGVDVSETGGPGATTAIRLRGANSGQTLVLIDGVRANDPGGASGEFDGAIIAPGLIDRIEVLRGPQSALYGSDAIGGVVNIITKKGRGKPVFSLGVEGGSYGTLGTTGSVSGSTGPWSYALSGTAQRSEGFSRYGYRIGRLNNVNNINGVPGGKLEADGYSRLGGFGRFGYDPGTGFRFNIGLMHVDTDQKYDAAFGAFPDTPATARRKFSQVSAQAELDTFDRTITHSLQVFANRTERQFEDVTLARVTGVLRETNRTITDFNGDRIGAEYQATWRLQQLGSVIAGGRWEQERADSFSTNVIPAPGPKTRTLGVSQDTMSAFALWQWPATERLNLSLGGRFDKVSDSTGFPTWRATVSYRILETGTKLRTSAGTGAKAPTLFQRFSPQFGTPQLDPETSFGFDAGIDQDFLNGRLTVSATYFSNRIRNLINFQSGPPCLATQTAGCYVNVARAATSGVEIGAKATLIDGWLAANAAYTYLDARDKRTDRLLARRAPHSARFALQITPTSQILIEPSVVVMSHRFSGNNETQRLAPFARFDIRAQYQWNETWRAHIRAENVTNARYQDVFNYGTTGRAIYAGLAATW